jgi:feruloyl esterase
MAQSLMFAAAHAEDCSELKQLKLPHVVISEAQPIAAGTELKIPDETAIAEKISFCRVQAVSKPTADSDIHFEVWIPTGGWNGKFEQIGNGGFAGGLPYQWMAHVLSLGYAVAGTDDGHQSKVGTDASWALHHPEKVKDFGWRAINETALASKVIVRKLTAKAPLKSYFVGCSDGGREALMMAQRFPAYFDGIIAGAPAFAWTRLMTGAAVRTNELGGALSFFPPPQLALLQHQALQSCGGGAPYLKDPRQCHVDLAALKCAGEASDTCLTEAQIATAKVVYADRKDPATGGVLYGLMPGAEAVKGSWASWITGSDSTGHAAGLAYAWNFWAYVVMNDPKLDLGKLSESDIVGGERRYASILDAENADLSAFKAHGGKLIQFHGWNDAAIAPGYSLEYRERMAAKTGDANSFYRLYMVPGMLHCRGGDAPTEVNWQTALENWVEKSVPPAELVASDAQGGTQTLQPFN